MASAPLETRPIFILGEMAAHAYLFLHSAIKLRGLRYAASL